MFATGRSNSDSTRLRNKHWNEYGLEQWKGGRLVLDPVVRQQSPIFGSVTLVRRVAQQPRSKLQLRIHGRATGTAMSGDIILAQEHGEQLSDPL